MKNMHILRPLINFTPPPKISNIQGVKCLLYNFVDRRAGITVFLY